MHRYIFIICMMLVGVTLGQKKKSTKVQAQTPKPIVVEVIANIRIDTTYSALPIFHENKILSFHWPAKIVCTDLHDKNIWQIELNSQIKFRPVIIDKEIIVSTSNGDLIAIDLNTGKQIQSIGLDEIVSAEITPFSFSGTAELMVPKQTESKSALILVTTTGQIICLDVETLQEFWRNGDIKDTIYSRPVVIKEKIITSAKDGFIVCLDARTGQLIWRWKESETSDFSKSSFFSDGKNIFTTSIDSTLYSIDIRLGRMNWKLDNRKVHNHIAITDDLKNIITAAINSNPLIISSSEGKIVKELKVSELRKSSQIIPIAFEKKILIAGKNQIFMIDEKFKLSSLVSFSDSEIIQFEQVEKNKYITMSNKGEIKIFTLR